MDVDVEVLRSLLARGAEAPDLDFKSTWDPYDPKAVLELAKDVAAMESLADGGYLVIGARDDGTPSKMFEVPDRSAFDEQRIRSKLSAKLGEPLGLKCALLSHNGRTYLLIGVQPHVLGFRIMERRHEFPGGAPAWEQSEVFVRRGTSSIRWNQHEARTLLERVIEQRKEIWRADVLETMRRDAPLIEGSGYVTVNLEIPLANFASGVLEMIRRDDRVGLDDLVRRTIRRAKEIASQGREGDDAGTVELSNLLYRLDALTALSARYNVAAVLQRCVSGFQAVHSATDEGDTSYQRVFPTGQQLVFHHLYVVGAFLVLDESWAAMQMIIELAPEKTHGGYWKTLLRKAEVMAARADLYRGEDGRSVQLIAQVKPLTAALFVAVDEYEPDLTNALVQFDVYRAISAGRQADGNTYPNFAFYNSQRAEPAFLTILQDADARSALFPGGTDAELRATYVRLDKEASQQAFAVSGWHGFASPVLNAFIG